MFYNLRKIRERQGISQRETARLLKISKSSYNYYETGEYIISLNHLNDFCNKFHVSMDYVVGLTDININSNITKRYRINPKIIGMRIKKIRKKKKMTQIDLAELLNTSQSNISAYENGKNMVLTAFAYTMAKNFNISLDYIVGRSNTIRIAKKK